ncbi:hypothetical protein [Brucella sp. 22210]|uniref:hypothetical protein n=1 Tax=Brucella sp. 22210 TaxID=3453892 RepID=UPI003F836DBE
MPSLEEYFNYWSEPAIENDRGIDRGPLIQPYYRQLGPYPRESALSLQLIIPTEWRQLFLPGQTQTDPRVGLNTLPAALAQVIRKLGFVPWEFYGRYGNWQGGGRRYILRPHSFPLSVALYRQRILPYFRAYNKETGERIPDKERFERTHEFAQFCDYGDRLRLADIEAMDPEAYMNELRQLGYWPN